MEKEPVICRIISYKIEKLYNYYDPDSGFCRNDVREEEVLKIPDCPDAGCQVSGVRKQTLKPEH